MSRKLIFHPLPRLGEGKSGFHLRLAGGNGMRGISALFGSPSPALEVLANFLGVYAKHNALAAISKQHIGVTATASTWNHRTSRFCPACVEEKDYWPQEWELSLFVACQHHRLTLVDMCPGCSQPVTWNRTSLFRCVCGHRLSDAPQIEASDLEVEFCRLLAAKLNGEGDGPAHLQLLRLDMLHRLAVVVGAYGRKKRGTKRLKIERFATLSVATELARPASMALLDWPNGFLNLLDQLHPGGKKATKLKDRFGYFYSYFFKNFRDPEYGPIRHAFETYLEKNWDNPLNNRNSFLSPNLRAKHTWVPAVTAAAALKTSRQKIARLIELNCIKGHFIQGSGNRKTLCVDQRYLPQVRGLLKDQADLKTACTMLGIDENRVKQLVKHEIIGPEITSKSQDRSRWAFSRSYMAYMLHPTSKYPFIHESSRSDAVSLGFACRYMLRREYLFPCLVMAVFKSEITPIAVAYERKGLAALIFRRRTLKIWIDGQVESRRGGVLTIPQAAEKLGLKQEVAYAFVNSGYIGSDMDQDTKRRIVTQEAINVFQETYILGRELADKYKVSPKSLASLLRLAGIIPVSGPRVDGSRQYLYRKEEVLENTLWKFWGNPVFEDRED